MVPTGQLPPIYLTDVESKGSSGTYQTAVVRAMVGSVPEPRLPAKPVATLRNLDALRLVFLCSSFPLRFKISPCSKQTVLKRIGTEKQRNAEIRKELRVSGSSRFRSEQFASQVHFPNKNAATHYSLRERG